MNMFMEHLDVFIEEMATTGECKDETIDLFVKDEDGNVVRFSDIKDLKALRCRRCVIMTHPMTVHKLVTKKKQEREKAEIAQVEKIAKEMEKEKNMKEKEIERQERK